LQRFTVHLQQALGVSPEALPLRGQRQRARVALEEPRPELLLQILNLRAGRRLSAKYAARAGRDAAGVRDGEEGAHQEWVDQRVGRARFGH
jgi:hypothetical protein